MSDAQRLDLIIPDAEALDLNIVMAGLSIHTQRAYKRYIRTFMHDALACDYDNDRLPLPDAIAALTPLMMRSWLGLLRTRNLGAQSLGGSKASLVWLAQVLADMTCIDYNIPAALSRVKLPRSEEGQRRGTWLSADQLLTLLKMARKGNSPQASNRNIAMISVLAFCGLRRDEITKLKWADIRLQNGHPVLTIHGKGSKLREVKLPNRVVGTLAAWRENCPHAETLPDIPIFTAVRRGGHVSAEGITDKLVCLVVKNAAAAAGFPTLAPHDLRRTFARGAYTSGASFELIRQTMGHSNVATTEHYVNCALELVNAASDIWADAVGDDIESEPDDV